MQIKKRFIYILLFLLVLALQSCVRYVDSRQDLAKRFKLDPAIKRIGPEGFYRYEQEQRKRLDILVSQRSSSSSTKSQGTYNIGPGDELKLTVKNLEEVNREYVVSSNGTIKLPFVGVVNVQGLSESDAASKIAASIQDYVVDPLVDVEVKKFSSNLVWVLDNSMRNGVNGNTLSQNAYPIKREGYTLIDLLLELQNTSYFDSGVIYFYPAIGGNGVDPVSAKKLSDTKQSLIDRFDSFNVKNWSSDNSSEKCDGAEYDSKNADDLRVKACYPKENTIKPEDLASKYDDGSRIEIDVEELFGGVNRRPLNIPLKAGDLIHIAPPPTVQIYGEVRAPGTFQAVQGAMMGGGGNNLKPYLLSAITAARGLTYAADIGNVEVYREIHFGNKAVLGVDLEKIVFLAGQDIKLRDGDLILVPSKHGRFYESTTIDGINSFTGSILNTDNANNVIRN